jgi:hypothetical protein
MSPILPDSRARDWSFGRLLAFRFAFIFVLLTLGTVLVIFIPFSGVGTAVYRGVEAISDIPRRLAPGLWPGGCAGHNIPWYCWSLESISVAIVAAVGALLWSLLDRRSKHHRVLHEFLLVTIRYSLAAVMWSFGWVKIYGTQFGVGLEGVDRVIPLAHWTPAHVMWETMGYSYAYQSFTGYGELAAAALLLWRRTASLGAMLMLVVAGTIMALTAANRHPYVGRTMFYVIMALIVIAPDTKRLFDLYVRNRRVLPLEPPAVGWNTPLWRKVGMTVKLLVIGWFFVKPAIERIDSDWSPNNRFVMRKPTHALSGLYEVQQQTRNGDTIPRRFDDSARWEYFEIGSGAKYVSHRLPTDLAVLKSDGSLRYYSVKFDTAKSRIDFEVPEINLLWGSPNGSTGRSVGWLFYERKDSVSLMLRGRMNGDSVELLLKKVIQRPYGAPDTTKQPNRFY